MNVGSAHYVQKSMVKDALSILSDVILNLHINALRGEDETKRAFISAFGMIRLSRSPLSKIFRVALNSSSNALRPFRLESASFSVPFTLMAAVGMRPRLAFM